MQVIIIVITALLFLITANVVYKKLEKFKIIPIKHHPYTHDKTKEFYWEFIRLYFFLICTIVFLISGYFKIFLGLLVITFLQIIADYTIYKQNNTNEKERIEVLFDEKDLLEQQEFLKTIADNKKKRIVTTKKIVFYNDYLYLSKRKKILTRERMYKYIHMSDIQKKNNLIIITYGFLGIPMFKKMLYIPRNKEKLMINILHKIENNKREKGFNKKYFEVFKNK